MLGLSTIKLVVFGLIAAAIVGYIGYLKIEVINYKAQATKYESAYNQVVSEQNAKIAALKTEEAAQDKVRAEQSAAQAKVIFDTQNANIKAIHENNAFKQVVIPNLARQLFNNTAPTSGGSDQEGASGQANTVNDATQSSVADILKGAQPGPRVPVIKEGTLEDLLAANEVNKANYEQCSKDKSDWITLWNQTVTALNGQTRSP